MASGKVDVVFQPIKPDDGYDDNTRRNLAMTFYFIFADQMVMLNEYCNYSKNVLGPHHTSLKLMWRRIIHGRRLHGEQLEFGLLEDINMVEDYIRGLGAKVPTITECLKCTRLPMPPEGKWLNWKDMVQRCLKNEETFIKHLMEDRKRCLESKDDVGEDLIDRMIRCHKRYAKDFRAHMESC